MLLTLSPTWSDTLDLTGNEWVTCDLSLSQAVMEADPENAQRFFQVVREKLPALWQALSTQVADNMWVQAVEHGDKALNFSLIVVTDAEIHQLNREFRDKDSPTDVLTFTLLGDATEETSLEQLPELNLGEVYLSLDWAKAAVCKQIAESPEKTLNFFHDLTLYLLERLIHGCLHLLGVHHDTMADYNKVLAIQRFVIDAITE